MAEIDTAQEWRRLQSLYAGMSEEELEAVAGEAYDLTDVAKQALDAEIAHRNLKLVVRLAPTPKEPEATRGVRDDFDAADLDLRIAIVVDNREQAEWVKKKLNQGGVLCRFGPQVIEDVDRVRFSNENSVDVRVLQEDEKRARYLLEDFSVHFGKREEKEEGDYSAHCPKCHSTEILLLGLDSDMTDEQQETEDSEKPEQTGGERAGANPQYNWSCDACGYQWKDDGVEMRAE